MEAPTLPVRGGSGVGQGSVPLYQEPAALAVMVLGAFYPSSFWPFPTPILFRALLINEQLSVSL